ncbi:pyroglutamyl-peptidase activity protein [Coemansia erecta]|nr:pyroglutamyl-peptidase activity protein [Coemansia erecta]
METVHVLLTGFEPFGTPLPKENRSWQVIKQLSGREIIVGNTKAVCHCYELPVSYNPVATMLPQMHLEHNFGLVVHCGESISGIVKLETCASKHGYKKPGNGGADDLPECGSIAGYNTPDTLFTEVDVEGLRKSLVANGWLSVATSNDAGRYLCEFTYYISLALAQTAYPERCATAPKTLFVHVPPKPLDPYSDQQLADIIRDIICYFASRI